MAGRYVYVVLQVESSARTNQKVIPWPLLDVHSSLVKADRHISAILDSRMRTASTRLLWKFGPDVGDEDLHNVQRVMRRVRVSFDQEDFEFQIVKLAVSSDGGEMLGDSLNGKIEVKVELVGLMTRRRGSVAVTNDLNDVDRIVPTPDEAREIGQLVVNARNMSVLCRDLREANARLEAHERGSSDAVKVERQTWVDNLARWRAAEKVWKSNNDKLTGWNVSLTEEVDKMRRERDSWKLRVEQLLAESNDVRARFSSIRRALDRPKGADQLDGRMQELNDAINNNPPDQTVSLVADKFSGLEID